MLLSLVKVMSPLVALAKAEYPWKAGFVEFKCMSKFPSVSDDRIHSFVTSVGSPSAMHTLASVGTVSSEAVAVRVR